MAKLIGNLCAPTGKYIKDGEEKTSWTKCGVLLETEKGFRVKLDTVPVGGGEQGIWFSVFDQDNKGDRQGSGGQSSSRASEGQASSTPAGFKDDDLPF